MLVALASCAVRAPAPIDVDQLVRGRDPIEARRDLEIRVTSDPRDVAGRLALAALDERIARPSEAIDALEAVEALGGPLGVRWRAEDRARLARLIAARGRARLARGPPRRWRICRVRAGSGAAVTDAELRQARAAGAVVALRHSDAETRSEGRRSWPRWPMGPIASRRGSVRGPRPGAEPRGRFGVWLWSQGAKRAAWDELSAWHAATHAPREPALQQAYLIAARWWTPLDLPAPPADDLVGPGRCAFVACPPREVAGDDSRERAFLIGPVASPVRDPDDAAALAVITLRQALRGEVSWGPALAARIDGKAFADPAGLAALPRYVQPMFARLAGRDAAVPGEADTPDQRLVLAAERALAGGSQAEVAALAGSGPYAEAVLRIVAPLAPAFSGDAHAEAAARHAGMIASLAAPSDELRAIAAAYAHDPLVADRLARDAVAGAVDAAVAHAMIGALFDALGDPARARAAWQAAVDASPEPAFLRGLAEAEAHQGDGDAAMIAATTAAAASGDPGVGGGPPSRGRSPAPAGMSTRSKRRAARSISPGPTRSPRRARWRAPRAGRSAVTPRPPRSPRSAPASWSRVAHRWQATRPTRAARSPRILRHRRTPARWPGCGPRRAGIHATRRDPYRAARRALPGDDLRRGAVTAELVELAGDRDPELRRAAVAALR